MESTNGRLSEDTLRKHFSNYGEVEEALILSDTDRGNETGFGYVAFKDPAGPIHALNQQHYILDTKVNVKPALWISSVTSLNKNTPPTVEMAGSSDNNKKIYKSYLEMENRLQMVGRADSDRNQGLIYTYDCNNTCLGSGRSDSETYGPYPPPAPQPPYAPPCGN
ncbi:uncharacterized protein LOC112003665 [Quercus suber]|uniref:uncharacterized protein LOC112003665 n=1 Tax=Quercus suber TaxID=58331 RepID=UPI0032DE6F71